MNPQPTTTQAYNLLHKGALAMARIEQAGMVVDLDYCRTQDGRIEKKLDRLQAKLECTQVGKRWRKRYGRAMALTNNHQLSAILYEDMKLDAVVRTKPSTRYPKGQPSTSWEALEQLARPELEIVRDWRRLEKARGTYLRNLLRETAQDGLFRPSFHLNTVLTYRGSAELFQTIPRRDPGQARAVRSAFRARPGRRIIEPDFSGMEVRTGACVHQDENMIRYMSGHGDMHKDASCGLFLLDPEQVSKEIRDISKNGWVFPQFYGSYYGNCAPNIWRRVPDAVLVDGTPLIEHLKSMGIGTLKRFTEHAKRAEDMLWNDQFPGYAAWKKREWKLYLKQGYIDLVTGFRCSGVMTEKEVGNYGIQGPAFHCLLQSIIWMWEEIDRQELEALIIGQIHDAAPTDTPAAESDTVLDTFLHLSTERLPKEWPWIIVPLEVEADAGPIGGSWHDKAEVKRHDVPCVECGTGHWWRYPKEEDPECLTCGSVIPL